MTSSPTLLPPGSALLGHPDEEQGQLSMLLITWLPEAMFPLPHPHGSMDPDVTMSSGDSTGHSDPYVPWWQPSPHTSTWSQAAAQTTDFWIAFGGTNIGMDPCCGGVTDPDIALDALRTEHRPGSRWLCSLLIATRSSPPSHLQSFLSPPYMSGPSSLSYLPT